MAASSPIQASLSVPEADGNAVKQERNSPRLSARDYYRSGARLRPALEPHEKYHIDPADYPSGCDVVWAPVSIKGMDSGQLRQYIDGGWIPARAEDFPDHSGYGTPYPDALTRSGRVKEVQPDDYIEKDGQMLFVRAQELSRAAADNRKRIADEQLHTQMRRLALASQRAIRDRTEVKYGRQYANPDQIPELRHAEGEI